jgi:hypothetical protein
LLSLRTKNIETAYNALALCAGFLFAPSVGGAVKVGFEINDVRASLTRADKTTLKNFTDKMISSAESALEGFAADAPPDAAVLYAQMLEFSAPKATDISGSALNADTLALHMVEQLEDPEHKSMRDLFVLLTSAALKPLLADPDFVEQIKPAIYAQMLSGTQAIQRDLAELVRKHGSLDAVVDTVKNAADAEFRILAAAFKLPDADTAPRSKLIADIIHKAQERDQVQAILDDVDDTDTVVQSYLEHAQTALSQMNLSAALFLLREARKALEDNSLRKNLEIRANIAEPEAMVHLLNSQPQEAFRLFESTANGMAMVDENDAAMRRSNYALALMAYGDRYGTDGYLYGTRLIDPLLSEAAAELPADVTARLFLHRGTIHAKFYAALGHLDGQDHFEAAEEDLISAQIIAADMLSDFHGAATARATAGWLNLQAAQFTLDADADPFLQQAEELLSIARKLYEQLDAQFELALVKLDLADLLDRKSVRVGQTERATIFQKAIDLVAESEEQLVMGDHPAELARARYLAAKLLWNEAVYRLGAGGAELLNSAMAFACSVLELRAVEADPLGWAEATLLIGEIRADQVIHNREEDRIAGFKEAVKTMQTAIKIYEEMGTEEQIAKARRTFQRLSRQIEEEGNVDSV